MPKRALRVAGLVFSVVSLLHLARLVLKFPVMVGSHYIPLRLNGVGFAVASILALWMFSASKKA
ncbi:MAG: hypothetical protein A3F82_10125 [Deltaproteobacteria bacterium RIFCSPLOWO2_12_FULL_44_12]|nr:MAG: hypothetical protein A2712_00205 [Deltaproteobacteria bacterium RIFCSPHIGHO2_01_FULL_43_49]OGQ15839.1 MAG: hypothetical protein A3D22_02855 [Deltaproteobacteria bacterium RIFCSPHIGHO2_02_FULL_44_53]OGQ28793.1 MAG: hypothetical protein A3D98_01185 [Deltaproteobacteria bacterium RIFCSPHIGHO2_12_FULL_44_21]OGQ32113.1 MAG: hypothetical protein A2979_03310 [Deltaproteobacteria bacterium RIFCSPLOWO2_01_FULL_45_74]OGQ43744.1 MAG: hypothetical protein A3I70_05680 [Deltaproteobacteria bacterium 